MSDIQFLESPLSDGTIDEDFEAALSRPFDQSSFETGGTVQPESLANGSLQSPLSEDFSFLTSLGILEVVGEDMAGRKMIVISACRLPPNKDFDHAKFLR